MAVKRQAPKPKTSGAGKKKIIWESNQRKGGPTVSNKKPVKPKPKAPAKKK